MSCQAVTTTIKATEAATVMAGLPKTGVLRIERDAGAMTGAAQITSKGGTMALRFSDGTAIYLRG